jgi:hypothetical protein
MAKGFVSSITDYAAHPFSEDMSLFDWFLFTGIILIFGALWAIMIRSISAIE